MQGVYTLRSQSPSSSSNVIDYTPIHLKAADGRQLLTIERPLFLAPMEGVTDPGFRRLVAERGGVGALCTEFIRISQAAIPPSVIERELGDWQEPCPIGVQFMAPGTDYLAESIAGIADTRAAFVDLNFGCPVKRVFNKCAGSALLDYPEQMEAIVRCAVDATDLPVTAKIRAGVHDPSRLHDIIDAVISGGAAMLCMHGRLRSESYAMPAHWDWLAEACARVKASNRPVPFIANGGVDTLADIDAVRKETACDGVMIGRGAIANPFVFRHYSGGPAASAEEMVAFIVDYWQAMQGPRASKNPLGRLKQLLKYNQCGILFDDEDQRRVLLRAQHIDEVWNFLSHFCDVPALQQKL